MTIEAAFLQAILESPDDDGLRLIYADWLEERGDPRGEFIRVQMELAKAGDDSLLIAHASGRPPCGCWLCKLRRREMELLTTDNRAKWTQPYPVEYHFTIEAFRRGFVEHISCTGGDWMTYGSFILWEQPVQEVTLTTFPGYGFLWLFRQQNGLSSWPGSESDHSLRLLETGWPQIKKWNLP